MLILLENNRTTLQPYNAYLRLLSFGAGKKLKSRFVFLSVRGQRSKGFWAARSLVSFHFGTDYGKKCSEYAFIQYMKCTDCLNGVDAVLNCIYLRRSTDDESDYSTTRGDGTKQLNSKR